MGNARLGWTIFAATLTLAAGLSSTGDAALDARLPLDEPYEVPAATVAAIGNARRRSGRIVALGTTVARALEHAAARRGGIVAGPGVADNRLGAATPLRAVDAIVSGTHPPGTSHHALLGAFVPAATLARIDAALEACGYRTHEFGDSVWIERASCPVDAAEAAMRSGKALGTSSALAAA